MLELDSLILIQKGKYNGLDSFIRENMTETMQYVQFLSFFHMFLLEIFVGIIQQSLALLHATYHLSFKSMLLILKCQIFFVCFSQSYELS